MNLEIICRNILEPFESMLSASGAGYIEVVYRENNQFSSFFKKSISSDFPYLSCDILIKTMELDKLESLSHTEQLSKYQKTIHCYIYPLLTFKALSGFMILQSMDALNDQALALTNSLADMLSRFHGSHQESLPQKTAPKIHGEDEKYHNELMNIRDIQAKLFPSFDRIEEFDIRSAYLPAELMSGTFIDGLFIDKSTYLLVACDVSEFGPASLFVGAAIRTIIRSEEIQKMIPSMMINTIESRIKNLTAGGNVSNIYLSIYQINLKNGKVVLSSYGPVSTLFYTAKKRGLIDLGDTEAGKLFAKRNFFRDLTLSLEQGDTLLYYTRGVLRAKNLEGDKEYGLAGLKQTIRENIEGGSLELVHAITESVYEFTDYNPINEDIILISIKMK